MIPSRFRTKAMSPLRAGLVVVLAASALSLPVFAQPGPKPDPQEEIRLKAPRVFLDGRDLQWDYIRTEVPFVNYVRDRTDADVHVLVTRQPTGSGGSEYVLAFIGLGAFADLNLTLRFFSNKTDVSNDIREDFVRTLKQGLAPFVSRTPLAGNLNVTYDRGGLPLPQTVRDKRDFWVFSLYGSGRASGVKTRLGGAFEGNFSASRVTPEWKIRTSVSGRFDASKYTVDEEIYESSTEQESFNALAVKSLGSHWSAGAWLTVSSASYNNIRLGVIPSLAVEYSFFPYVESTRRQLYLQYRLGVNSYRYRELTIYEKTDETLLRQSLSLNLEFLQPWGNANATIRFGHYMNDLALNRLDVSAGVSVRLFKGLSFWAGGSYAAIHDQISLPMEGATLEQILLMRKDQATTYSFSLNLGLNFTFGSMYSNVVNPRFE
jgi:hypothetical protein